MVDPNIVWPVLALDKLDPAFMFSAVDAQALGEYIEFYNSEPSGESDETTVLYDAKGRKLGGKIDLLNVLELYIVVDATT